MAALKCTIASVPARESVFVLTDANARTGKRGEGGGEVDSKVLGEYGRDKLNENGKLQLGFAEDNKHPWTWSKRQLVVHRVKKTDHRVPGTA